MCRRLQECEICLVKPAFAESDLPDFFQQPFKIVFPKKRTVFHAFPVKHIALNRKFSQHAGCPLSKLSGPFGIDPVAHGNNGIDVIEIRIVFLAIRGSCSEFPNN